MAGSNNCGECHRPTHGLDGRIECNGCCGKFFHLPCVQLNEFDHRRCVDSANLLWLCNRCLSLFRIKFATTESGPVREDSTLELNYTIDDIEANLRRLKLEINELTSRFSEVRDNTVEDQALKSSTSDVPCTSTPICDGRNSSANGESTNSVSRLSTGSKGGAGSSRSSNRFWLFFTRVARHVTETDIIKVVTDCLNLDSPPVVVKVTPRWISENDRRYNSFKIGIQYVCREIALRESTWPCGLMFKEFENHSLNSAFWEP